MKTVLFLTIALSFTAVFGQATKKELQKLSGTYASSGSEDWGQGTFGFREFKFDDSKWSLKFTLALDPGLTHRVFEFRTFGNYEVLNPSKVEKGVYDALFYEDKKFVTLLTDNQELIQGFGLSDCGLIPNVEKDISVDGCAIWPSVADCHEDHDLLKLSGSRLYFGVRPADNNMCTADKRPTALLPPVIKQNDSEL